jgi:hypothetical protein
MDEKPIKAEIGFQEALRRIAKMPKAVIAEETKQEQVPKGPKKTSKTKR